MPLPKEIEGKWILFSCFDWGMGHLMRSIPLIIQLELQGNIVRFLGNDEQIGLLKFYGFKGETFHLDGAQLKFSGSGNFILEGLRNLFRGPGFIRNDKKRVKQILKQFPADYIVSDHRYGFLSKKVFSIFLTHQVELPPNTPRLIKSVHRNWMEEFQEIWVLDDEKIRLAGELSNLGMKGKYIGLHSRFEARISDIGQGGGVVGIVSGPEPYSEQLFNDLIELAAETNRSLTIIYLNIKNKIELPQNIRIIDDCEFVDNVILKADLIISRNGYTTLMDLQVLNKRAIFIPTPGQEEQLYLASIDKNPFHKYAFNREELFLAVKETI